jgi:DNA polymerase I-like protein with 3'-5' exonuclease and polymerase domains
MAFKVPRYQEIPPEYREWTNKLRAQSLNDFNLSAAKEITIDTETYDPDLKNKGPGVRTNGYIVGISVATEDAAFYLPIRHALEYNPNGVGFLREHVMRWAKNNLCRAGVPKIGANLLYDLDFLWEAGVEIPGPYLDIQIAEPLIDENQHSFSLDRQGFKYLGVGKEKSDMEDWLNRTYGKDNNQRKNIYRCPPELVAPYAIADVTMPQQIIRKQLKIIEQQELDRVWDIEKRLVPMMLAMRRRGVMVDVNHAKLATDELTARKNKIRKQIGIKDIWNAEQVAEMCNKSRIAYPLTAKTKKPSFTALWLEKHEDPRLRKLVEARKLDKTVTTFIQGAVLGNAVNGRVHTLFHQLKTDANGTVSGRFSSSNPNLQNIPSRDEELGPLMRSMFIPDPDEVWYSDDWSQIEFRELVHYGKGPSALATQQAYRDDPTTDFHDYVASITGIDRKPAKNINFGLGYGMGIEKLARQLGVTREKAEEIFAMYHARLPFIKALMKKVSRVAENRGYIMTLLGRRRRFDLWEPRDYSKFGYNYKDNKPTPLLYDDAVLAWGEHGVKRAFGYAALNALMQGSAADLMKMAMVNIWESGVCDVLGAPLLTVHDELNWSVPRTDIARQAHAEAARMMKDVYQLRVPLLVSSDHGANWAEAH